MKADRAKIRKLEVFADKLLQSKLTPENPQCIVCGGQTSCMHHVVFKSQSNALRYNPLNLVGLCSKCHTRLHFSGDPAILGTIIKVKGIDWFDELQKIRHTTICKHTKEYLEGIIESLSKPTPF
jgi:5-methylcytosine-specific restriction endonuclease McrA